MYVDDGSVVEITASTFSGNEANTNENSGAGIWVHSGYVDVEGCKFENNVPNDLTRNGGTINIVGCSEGYFGSSGAALSVFGDMTGSLVSYDCSACAEGKTTAVGGEACTDCAPGKYSDVEGAAACKSCGINSYSTTWASTSCQTCPTGRYSSDETAAFGDSCRYFAPNSVAEISDYTVVAGEVKVMPLTLKENTNNKMLGTVDFNKDWVLVTANTTIQSEAYNRTFLNAITNAGEYSVSSDGQPQVTMTFDAATRWTVRIQNPVDESHFSNSPLTITVLPSTSAPASMELEVPATVVAGDKFYGKIRSFDEFLNPTFSPDDDIMWWISGPTEMSKVSAVPKPSSRDYLVSSDPILLAGSYRFHCSLNGVELPQKGFLVLPAAVHADSTTHNLLNVDYVDSTLATTWEVQVIPRDAFGNLIIDFNDEVWFTLELDTAGNVQDTEVLDLTNDYKHSIYITQGAELSFGVSIYFKGTDDHIKDSPMTINVSPAPVESLVPLYVGVGVTLLLMPLSIWVYKKAASRGISRDAEKRLSADERLLDMIRNRIKRQYFWLLVEVRGGEERSELGRKGFYFAVSY